MVLKEGLGVTNYSLRYRKNLQLTLREGEKTEGEKILANRALHQNLQTK